MNTWRVLRLIVILAGAFSIVPPVRAAATGGAEAGSVTLRFRVFALRPIENLSFVPSPGAAPEPLEFYPTARSPEYVALVSDRLTFVDAVSGAVAAEVAPAPELTRALLVFVPARRGSARRFDVLAFDDDPTAHGAGQFSILNLSGLELRGMLGRRALRLDAGRQRLGAIRGTEKLELRASHAGREYRAYRDQVTVGRDERALLVLFPPFYAGSLEVQGRLLVDEVAPSAMPVGGRR